MRNDLLHPATEMLEAYVEGTLEDADRAVIESHLAGCPECATEVEEWEALFDLLAALPHLEPTATFADRIMASVELSLSWHAQLGAFLRRLIPETRGGWALLSVLISLPLISIGGALTWLVSRPWLSLEALWLFTVYHLETLIVEETKRLAVAVLGNQYTLWLVERLARLFESFGKPGFGIGVMVISIATTLSIWVLYRNLFRDPARGGSHATT